MLLLLAGVIFFITLIIVIWCYYTYNLYKHLKNIPGPMPLPLIGNGLDLQKQSPDKEILDSFLRLQKEYGPIYKTIIGFQLSIVVADYKIIEQVLGSSGPTFVNKSIIYNFFHSWLGTGLLTSQEKKWRKHRKIITPTFHFTILEQFIDVFNSASEILVENLNSECDKGPIEIFSIISLCTLDIICETAMGTSVNAQRNKYSEYVQCVKNMVRIVSERSVSPIEQFDFLFYFTKNGRNERKSLKVLHSYTESVIKQRKEAMKNNEDSNGSDTFTKKKRPFLDLLLQEGQLTDEEIRQEVDTFMFEGHDTTAVTLSFMLLCLSQNPEVQNKVVDELKRIFVNDNRVPNFRDLHEMKYIEMVIKETLRLYPAIPITGREVTEPVEINGCTVPIGTSIMIFIYSIHRDPQFFPDPEKFIPERFSPENTNSKNPYCYIPFSAGPRNCIGQKYAMFELKATLTHILRNFEILPVPGFKPQLRADAVLKSTNGVYVELKHRK